MSQYASLEPGTGGYAGRSSSAVSQLLEWLSTCLAALDLRQCLPMQMLTAGEEVEMNGKKFQILKQVGEGGYSFVFLVRDLNPTPEAPVEFALKKVLAGSSDALTEARREIEVMQKMRHPHLLPLLAYSIKELVDAPEAAATHVIYMLFPIYTSGTVFDEVTRLRSAGKDLDNREALNIFLQVLLGVRAMHTYATPYAHRDIKPHNILLNPRGGAADAAAASSAPSPSRRAAAGQDGGEVQPLTADAGANSAARDGCRFSAVLMDFGSAAPAHVVVMNRNAALAVQEDAEAHCTAAYRAPELFDVPSNCTIDEAVDVWSLGCTLYFMMYGESPFERALNERGGSLALAVINGQVPWPKDDQRPEEMRALVREMLDPNPEVRPRVDALISRVQALLPRV